MKQPNRSGFTIIEAVLVLGIAGLIFLMIFVALPSLQRAQRDSRRRDDMSILVRKLKDFQTANRGALPGGSDGTYTYSNNSAVSASSWGGFYRDYLGDKFEDPIGGQYVLDVKTCSPTTVGSVCKENMPEDSISYPNGYKVSIVRQAMCDGNRAVASKNIRRVAVQYKMQGAGVHCANT